jgi:1,4-dihydroxy-2-naphthoyl-CoA hydrolase
MSGDFADRFDPSIAAAMIELGGQIEGLPAYLGIELTRAEPGQLWARANLGAEILTPSGNVHGGALAAILDHVTGAVIYPLMPAGSWGATTELKINYIAPVQAGEVEAEATVLAMTKRSAVVRGELHYGGRLCSAAQGTITVVGPRGESRA